MVDDCNFCVNACEQSCYYGFGLVEDWDFGLPEEIHLMESYWVPAVEVDQKNSIALYCCLLLKYFTSFVKVFTPSQ